MVLYSMAFIFIIFSGIIYGQPNGTIECSYITLYLKQTLRLLCWIYAVCSCVSSKQQKIASKITYLEVDNKRKANTAEPIKPIDFVNEVHIKFIFLGLLMGRQKVFKSGNERVKMWRMSAT